MNPTSFIESALIMKYSSYLVFDYLTSFFSFIWYKKNMVEINPINRQNIDITLYYINSSVKLLKLYHEIPGTIIPAI